MVIRTSTPTTSILRQDSVRMRWEMPSQMTPTNGVTVTAMASERTLLEIGIGASKFLVLYSVSQVPDARCPLVMKMEITSPMRMICAQTLQRARLPIQMAAHLLKSIPMAILFSMMSIFVQIHQLMKSRIALVVPYHKQTSIPTVMVSTMLMRMPTNSTCVPIPLRTITTKSTKMDVHHRNSIRMATE